MKRRSAARNPGNKEYNQTSPAKGCRLYKTIAIVPSPRRGSSQYGSSILGLRATLRRFTSGYRSFSAFGAKKVNGIGRLADLYSARTETLPGLAEFTFRVEHLKAGVLLKARSINL
jgi:hypothetical protein